MLFDKQIPDLAVDSDAPATGSIQGTFAFDWATDSFEMLDGSPVMVRGREAAKEWINLVARTRQGRLGIYPVDFGADAMSMIGKKIPKGYKLSEFRRMMEESVRYCDGIQSVGGFTYDGERINFSVTLTDGGEEEATIGY